MRRDCTISLHGAWYEVATALRGREVEVRFDPAAPPATPLEIWHQGKFVAAARRLDKHANASTFASRNYEHTRARSF